MTTQFTKESSERSNVESIRERPQAQVLIIGGGINGIGTFRDLALQGVDVILVERNDYASGASAASSHMIHGGIRYLENGEFRLVRESVRERNGLLKIAPHYVKPLKTTIPIFSTFSGVLSAPLRFVTHKQGKPKERGAFLIKIGLTLYDAFSRDGGSVPRHEFSGRRKSLAALPALNSDIKYTATYYDGSLVNPERLALDVLNDGLATGRNARAANYVEAIGVSDGSVRLRDRESGHEFLVHAEVVVNASGPWTDMTNTALGNGTEYMGGTKGSHIVLDSPELLAACDGRELFFENDDGRIVLIYPLNGRVLIGTTDLEADMNQPAVCTDEEIDYFIGLVAHVFPDIEVARSQIVYRFAGVRPLPHHDDTQPGFVSRDYRIVHDSIPGLDQSKVLSLVGGKWTTFRALGEQLSDEVLRALGVKRKVSTARLAIGGGRGFPTTESAERDWIARYGADLPPERARQLLASYGTHARAVIDHLAAYSDTLLVGTAAFTAGEIDFMARNELVVHLSDVLLRRTTLAFSGALTGDLVEQIGAILSDALGWSATRLAEELASVQAELASSHGIDLTLHPKREGAVAR